MFKPLICTALVLASGMALAQDRGDDRDARRAEWQAKAEAKFAEADKDGDGALDRVEAQLFNERIAKNFERLDADKSGKIDRAELAAARKKGMRGGHRMRGAMAYQRGLFVGMDDDGDGAISRAELGNKVPRWNENFAAIDANGDGKLSKEELRAWQREAMKARRASREG